MHLERYALYPHQVTGVGFLATRGRAILGDDMGLGKTRQAIIAMKEAAPEGVFLVICPASLKLNWAREISVVDPLARLEVLGVAGYEHPQPQWVIVNYDLLASARSSPSRQPKVTMPPNTSTRGSANMVPVGMTSVAVTSRSAGISMASMMSSVFAA